jgi:uncharacterized phage protein (TIGR01671 family)
MREIKFRAWDKARKQMFSAHEMGKDELSLHPNGLGFFNPSGVSPKLSQYYEHMLPLQYAGLRDKNSKPIYEGDIVKIEDMPSSPDTREFIDEIVFNDGCFLAKNQNITLDAFTYEYPDNGYKPLRIEIIGNIYENPELLDSN